MRSFYSVEFSQLIFVVFLLKFPRAYLDKTVALQLNKGRKVSGTLRGYDQFMNLVLGDAVEEANNTRNNIGIVVSRISHFSQISDIKQIFLFFRSVEEIVFYKWN